MKHLLNTLYVLSEDIYLSLDGENVVANRGKQAVACYPLHTLQNCQRQAENVDFRRNGMSFFGGQHSGVYSRYTPHHLPA